ncbi:MAG: hypothetical protein RMK61_01565 [Bacteroidota bacterium]|nr:hypothetical protein [Bacteroidota bacterium]
MSPRRWTSILRGLSPWTWGLADHLLWSMTSFALTLAAARSLGPSGLGMVTIGFTAALLAIGLQRSFMLDPFLAAPAAKLEQEKGGAAILTLSMLGGIGASLLVAFLGLLLGGPMGAGLLAFAPSLVLILLQDALRTVVYRAGSIREAAIARALWLGVFCLLFLAGFADSLEAIAGTWGLGAGLAAFLLAWQLRAYLAPIGAAVRFWRKELGQVGGPVGIGGLLDSIAGQAEAYIAALTAGVGALGGVRAATSVFAPLTFLRPAIGQVSSPRIACAMERGTNAALRLAIAISGTLFVACLLYAGGAAVYGRLIAFVFGEAFYEYRNLLLPITAYQVISALGTGVHVYLLAAGLGRVILVSSAVAVPLRLAATAWLGARFGAAGLAWALVVAGSVLFAIHVWGVASDFRQRQRIPDAQLDAR